MVRRNPLWRRTDAVRNGSGGREKGFTRRQAADAGGRRRHMREEEAEDFAEDSDLSDSPQSQLLASKVVPCCHKTPFDPPSSDTRSGLGGASTSGLFGRLDPNQFMLACYAQLYTQYYKAYASRSEGTDLTPPFPDRDSYARLSYASQPGQPGLPVMSGSEYRRVTLVEAPEKSTLTSSSSRFSGVPAKDPRASVDCANSAASLHQTTPKKEEGEKKAPARKATGVVASNHASGQSQRTPERVSTRGKSENSSDTAVAVMTTEKDADEVQSLEEGEAVDDDEDSGETENSEVDCAETEAQLTNDTAARSQDNLQQRNTDTVEYDSPPSRRVSIEKPPRGYFPPTASGMSDMQFPFEVPPYLLSLMASSINFPELANRQLNDYLTNSIKTVPFLPIVLKNAFGTSFPMPSPMGERQTATEESGRRRRGEGGGLSPLSHSRASTTQKRESPKKPISTSGRSSKQADRRQRQRPADPSASPSRSQSSKPVSVERRKKEIRYFLLPPGSGLCRAQHYETVYTVGGDVRLKGQLSSALSINLRKRLFLKILLLYW
ncbi:hypothetical protein AAHC03_024261 [Spirometra sp. Aus1]